MKLIFESIREYLPYVFVWAVFLVIGYLLVKRTGFSKTPLKTAEKLLDKSLSMLKELDTIEEELVKTVTLARLRKSLYRAKDALSIYIFDNRLNKTAANAMETLTAVTELFEKYSMDLIVKSNDVKKDVQNLITETELALAQVKEAES
ncbi:MAG: hypothetical protein K5634_01710 [Sphaerochaetaceae bacterium]|nr:hypothetical protein [Sphaerochaetaceae bacterium]